MSEQDDFEILVPTRAGSPISLEDSFVQSISRSGEVFAAAVRLWDESQGTLTIRPAIAVEELLAGDLSYIRKGVVRGDESQLVSRAQVELYGRSAQDVALFELVDPEDRVSIRVVGTLDAELSFE